MRRIAAAIVIVGALAFRGVAVAQELGTVAGVVTDTAGAVLPGVSVRVASVGLVERVRSTITDGSGRYRVVNLPAGLYSATFSLVGFNPVVRIGVEVMGGLTTGVDGELNVGPLDFTDRVSGPRPLVSMPSAARMRPYVRCGLTIVPADPTVDPKIRVSVDSARRGPSERGTGHSMRTIAPGICATPEAAR